MPKSKLWKDKTVAGKGLALVEMLSKIMTTPPLYAGAIFVAIVAVGLVVKAFA